MKDSGVEWIGKIPEDWGVRRLKDFLKIVPGATPASNNPIYWDGNIVWVTPADYKTEDIYIKRSKRMITQEGLDSCATTLVPVDSIIVSNRAPIGQVALAKTQLCTNQGCKALVNKNDGVDNKFVYYYLSVMSNPLNMLGKGTTFLELSSFDLGCFSIPITSLDEQQKISNFLDQKVAQIYRIIEKTKETIEEYKEYKQSLITETVTKGLNPDVEMKDSGIEWIGEIPKHWKVVKLKKLTTKIIDGTHTTPTYMDDGIPFLRVTDITADTNNILKGVNWGNTAKIPLHEHLNLIKRCKPEKGDLLLSKNGTIGVPRIIDWDHEFSIFVSLCLIKVNKLIDVNYLYYYFKSSLILMEIAIGGKTGTITNLHLEMIKEFLVPFPNKEEQYKIVNFLNSECSKIDSIITQKEQLVSELESYKKSLIYEYVTGKKQVV